MTDLDQLRIDVAKAKGWRWYRAPENNPDGQAVFCFTDDTDKLPGWWLTPPPVLYEVGPESPCVHRWDTGLPDYPRDIAAAWELVEEMEKAGEVFAVAVGFIDGRPKDWFAGVETDSNEQPRGYPTAPEAICRAYLSWKAGKR